MPHLIINVFLYSQSSEGRPVRPPFVSRLILQNLPLSFTNEDVGNFVQAEGTYNVRLLCY